MAGSPEIRTRLAGASDSAGQGWRGARGSRASEGHHSKCRWGEVSASAVDANVILTTSHTAPFHTRAKRHQSGYDAGCAYQLTSACLIDAATLCFFALKRMSVRYGRAWIYYYR